MRTATGAMWRVAAVVALLGLSAVAARGGMAQSAGKDAAAAKTPAATGDVVIAYGGAEWALDPERGPVQAVVTRRTVDSGGVTLEGIVFLHDPNGWRAAGTFVGANPPAAIRDASVDAELTLAVMGE